MGPGRWNGLCPEVSTDPNVCFWKPDSQAEGHRHDSRREPVPHDEQDLRSHLQAAGSTGMGLPVRGQCLQHVRLRRDV